VKKPRPTPFSKSTPPRRQPLLGGGKANSSSKVKHGEQAFRKPLERRTRQKERTERRKKKGIRSSNGSAYHACRLDGWKRNFDKKRKSAKGKSPACRKGGKQVEKGLIAGKKKVRV